MPFDPVRFLKDYGISTKTEGKNTSYGWVNICCPVCPTLDTGYHGGFSLEKGYYSCWRCQGASLTKLISVLIKVSYGQAMSIITKYSYKRIAYSKTDYVILSSDKTKLPPFTDNLKDIHIKYLESRNFDPEKLVWEFDLRGTQEIGDYNFRIIAPIYINRKLVSFQGRDITGLSEARYKACKTEEEVIHHKYTLYNLDSVKDDKAIIVEGITDVWRIGNGSVATFGTGVTRNQIIEIASRFNQVFILFDNEPEAQEKAERIGWEINGLGVKVDIIEECFAKDPGSMPELEAKYLRKHLIGY